MNNIIKILSILSIIFIGANAVEQNNQSMLENLEKINQTKPLIGDDLNDEFETITALVGSDLENAKTQINQYHEGINLFLTIKNDTQVLLENSHSILNKGLGKLSDQLQKLDYNSGMTIQSSQTTHLDRRDNDSQFHVVGSYIRLSEPGFFSSTLNKVKTSVGSAITKTSSIFKT